MKNYIKDTENIHCKLVELGDCSRWKGKRIDRVKKYAKQS